MFSFGSFRGKERVVFFGPWSPEGGPRRTATCGISLGRQVAFLEGPSENDHGMASLETTPSSNQLLLGLTGGQRGHQKRAVGAGWLGDHRVDGCKILGSHPDGRWFFVGAIRLYSFAWAMLVPGNACYSLP